MTVALKVACLQLQPRHRESASDYLDEVEEQVLQEREADLIVLPELWSVGYFAFDDYEQHATALDGPLVQRLSALARRTSAVLHAGSVVERSGTELYNTSVVFGSDGALLATYRKMHVFGYQSREPELISAGRTLATAPVSSASAGLAICYDLRFPEVFRAMVDDVAIFIVPATWPASRVEHWQALLRARAVENQAFVIGCNAAGRNGDVELGGSSAVIDPWGGVLAQAGPAPEVLRASIDLSAVTRARSEFPVLRDRVLAAPSAVRAPMPEAAS